MNRKIFLTTLISGGLALTCYGYASSISAKTNINPQEGNTISSIEETEVIASSQYPTYSSEDSGNIDSNQIAQNNVCTFNKKTANIRLTKIEPCQNNVVPSQTMISGNVTDPDDKVWLVVYPLASGGCFIQNGPIPVNNTNKQFIGQSYFGNAKVGGGEQFQVQAIISNNSLTTGVKLPLDNCPRPKNGSSELITITRTP